MQATDLLPMDGDVAKITRRAEEFRDLPEPLQRNLQTFLTLTMDALATAHQKIKASMVAEATRQMVSVHDILLTTTYSECFGRLLRRSARNRGQS